MSEAEDLERAVFVLEGLAATPSRFFEKEPALGRMRAAASRLVAAIQEESRERRREQRLASSRRAASVAIEKPDLARCYMCRARTESRPLCPACRKKNDAKRALTRDLAGRVALVTGGRVNLGRAIVLKLLRAGARVALTTRDPSAVRFSDEKDEASWRDRVSVHALDLRDRGAVERFADELGSTHERLDVVVNNAAQTVREPGARTWELRIGEVPTAELEEVLAVNAVAPFVLVQRLLPLLERTPAERRYVVNVASLEGRFSVASKQPEHPHTNMAKAALAMLTRTAASDLERRGIVMVSVDPGWCSLQQAPEEREALAPPLDFEDGAARVLDPVFSDLRVGGVLLRNFEPVPW